MKNNFIHEYTTSDSNHKKRPQFIVTFCVGDIGLVRQ